MIAQRMRQMYLKVKNIRFLNEIKKFENLNGYARTLCYFFSILF